MTDHDAIEKVRVLIAAASRADDLSLRALYVAEARSYVEAEAVRLDGARSLVTAQEAELARVTRVTT